MFIRMAIVGEDSVSHQQQGVFQAAWDLLASGDLTNAEAEDLRSLLEWFNANMPFPSEAERRVLSHRAIFWFRPSARGYIKKAWELLQLLRMAGYLAEVLKTQNPGSIVYEDRCQIAAIPFKDTF
jgi:hypothetical protein